MYLFEDDYINNNNYENFTDYLLDKIPGLTLENLIKIVDSYREHKDSIKVYYVHDSILHFE